MKNTELMCDYIENQLVHEAGVMIVRGKSNRLNKHKAAEHFYRKLLNKIFQLNLESADIPGQPDAEGIDLIDTKRSIVVSVSGTSSKAKVQDGLTKTKNTYNGFRYIFVSIIHDAKNLRKQKYKIPDSISFNPARDVLDIPFLMEAIRGLDEFETIKSIYDDFKNEFERNLSENESTQIFDIGYFASKTLERHQNSANGTTLLMAEQREIDTYVDLVDETADCLTLPVTDIPQAQSVSYLLGDSGSGKTTSLWRVFTDTCQRIVQGKSNLLPIYIDLRKYSKDKRCFSLVEESFSYRDGVSQPITDILYRNTCLFLVDGLNEVQMDLKRTCYFELAEFILTNRHSSTIIACRTADYYSNIIPFNEFPSTLSISVYEISRLSKDQIVDYVTAYYSNTNISPNDFLNAIEISNETAWASRSSSLHLARIPLFLQIFIKTYHKTRTLPESRAKLLSSLVQMVLDRERGKSEIVLEPMYLDGLLSIFADKTFCYSLEFPTLIAKEMLLAAFKTVTTYGLANQNITFVELWKKLISANILREQEKSSVSWLHQLIRDYYLGVFIAQKWSLDKKSSDIDLHRPRRFESLGNDIAVGIALDILGPSRIGASFLYSLFYQGIEDSSFDFAQVAFESQISIVRSGLASQVISVILTDGDYETKILSEFSIALPYIEIIESLNESYYSSTNSKMRPLLVDAISAALIKYLPITRDDSASHQHLGWYSRFCRMGEIRKTVKRAEEILYRHLRGRDEFTVFYAIRGLWESDKSACSARLRELSGTKDPLLKGMIDDLVDEWGIA